MNQVYASFRGLLPKDHRSQRLFRDFELEVNKGLKASPPSLGLEAVGKDSRFCCHLWVQRTGMVNTGALRPTPDGCSRQALGQEHCQVAYRGLEEALGL